MLTILDVVRKTTDFLAQSGVPNPRLDAEWIMAHSLNVGRMDLYLQFERPLNETELAPIRELVRRRGDREPLQHILGFVDFADLRIACDARALIPRPETEELLEILKGELASSSPARILDLGTGSGVLALALAKCFPVTNVLAVDASEEALDLARENATANNLVERVRFLRSNWFADLVEGEDLFDLIVSNPPYLSQEEWTCAEAEVREHDPKSALVAKNNGRADLLVILENALGHLCPGGLLAMETGEAHHDLLIARAKTAGYVDSRSLRDLAKKNRFFLARRKKV